MLKHEVCILLPNPHWPKKTKRQEGGGQKADDKDEVFFERIDDIGQDMEDAMAFLKTLDDIVKDQEDIKMIQDMDQTCQKAVETHNKMLQTTAKELLSTNALADKMI